MKTTVNHNETLLDIAVTRYNDLARLFDLAFDNDLAVDADPDQGTVLSVEPQNIAAPKKVDLNKPRKVKEDLTVKHRQNLSDVAIQKYGSIAGVFDLLVANNISPDHEFNTGDKIASPEVIDEQTKQFYRSFNIIIATGIDTNVAPLERVAQDFDPADFDKNDFY